MGEKKMRHIRKMTLRKADAFTNFLNAVWRAWQDFKYEKKNEIGF
jgi:hypothetical protein